MAEEDPDEPSEGESEESSSRQSPGESENEPEDDPAGRDDDLTPEELAEEVLEDDPSTGEDPESEDDDSPSDEGGSVSESSEETGSDPESESDDELSPEELAEEVLQETSPTEEESQSPENPPSDPDEAEEGDRAAEEDELSPEELAEEVLGEEESTDPSDADEPDEDQPDEEASPEQPDLEPTEDTESAEDPEDEAEDEEVSPEELAEEAPDEESDELEGPTEEATAPPEESQEPNQEDIPEGEDSAESPAQEETPPEESTEADLEEEEEVDADEETGSRAEQQPDQGEIPEQEDQGLREDDGGDETPDEDASGAEPSDEDVGTPDESESSEQQSPEQEDDEGFEEPSDEDLPEEEDGDDASSIQDMLEQEAKRSRQEEQQEGEEDELPEGYMTVEQLPEQEEFEFPDWSKTTGWILVWLMAAGLVVWYLAMPLWEVYLMNQMKSSFERNNLNEARSWAEVGLFLNGAFIKNDGVFLADYLKQLLNHREFERFRSAYRNLGPGVKPPPVLQTYAEYQLNRGRWEQARSTAESLQRWVETRGIGYLFHAKASLELGNFEIARSDLNQVTNWMSRHPTTQRILRDIYYAQGDYRSALETSNQLQDLAGSDPWRMKVDDYVRLAQINKELNKRRVAQQMLERALELNPNHKGALQELGRQYVMEGRWERAEPLVDGSDYREGYRSLFPFEGFGWWAGAEIELSNENLSRSIRYVERAVELEPRNPEVHRVEGSLYLDHLSRPDQAVEAYERARDLGLRRLTFYNKLGQAYYRSGEYLSAAKTFEVLKDELEDTHPALTYNIGSSYLGAGEFEDARKRIRKAFNRGFKNQKSYNQWGLLLELEGRKQDALAKYFEGIEWGRRENEPVDLVQSNLDRAFSKRNPDPLSDWLAPLSSDFEIPTWRTMSPKTVETGG